jgi:hypothetical protein
MRVGQRSVCRGNFQLARAKIDYSLTNIKCGAVSGVSSAGFSLWGFVLARTKPHRLKPALLG